MPASRSAKRRHERVEAGAARWALVYYRICAQLERPGRTKILWSAVVGVGLLLALTASHKSPVASQAHTSPGQRDDAHAERAAGSLLSAAEAQVAAAGAAVQARTTEAGAARQTFSLLAYSANKAELKERFGRAPQEGKPDPLYTLVYDTSFDLRLERLAEVIIMELPAMRARPTVVLLPSERTDGSIFPTANALAAGAIDPNATCIVQTQALRKQYRIIRDGSRRVASRDGKPQPPPTAWWMVHDLVVDPQTKPLLLANEYNLEVFATERAEAAAPGQKAVGS